MQLFAHREVIQSIDDNGLAYIERQTTWRGSV